MTRILISPTEAFKQAVKAYQKANRIKSWSQALLHLAALGYEKETGEPSPEPYESWGGWRGKQESINALMDYADRATDNGKNDPTEAD